MAEYIEYHPLKFWLDPASIAEIVAHIQTYLVNNPINSTTEIETIIHDYLIAHPELIGGVESVNGETGEVVLTADNISAGENVTIKDVLDSLQDQIDDIVASIPSDYHQLIDDVSDLKSALEDSINWKQYKQSSSSTYYYIKSSPIVSNGNTDLNFKKSYSTEQYNIAYYDTLTNAQDAYDATAGSGTPSSTTGWITAEINTITSGYCIILIRRTNATVDVDIASDMFIFTHTKEETISKLVSDVDTLKIEARTIDTTGRQSTTWKSYRQNASATTDRIKCYPFFANKGSKILFNPDNGSDSYLVSFFTSEYSAVSGYNATVGSGSEDHNSGWISADYTFTKDSWVMVLFRNTTRSATVSDGNKFTIYLMAEFANDTDIIQLNPVESKLLNAKRCKNVSKNGYLSETPVLTLLHFSDIHSSSRALFRLLQFLDAYNAYIDDTICTGDMITSHWENTNAMGWWNNLIGSKNILTVIGNHDAYSTGNWSDNELITQTQQYETYLAPHIANWGVTYTQNLTYYYKDYSAKKIRLIVLNVMLQDSEATAQNTWLQNTLSTTPSGYTVIIAEHYPPSTPWATIKCTFCDEQLLTIGANGQIQTMYQTSVQTFINNGGLFGFWFCGHTHRDYVITGDGFSNQLFICVGAASVSAGNTWGADQRDYNTKTEDLFNLLTVDTSTHTAKIIRVGSDIDNLLRKKEILCIDYQTKEVLSNF